MNYRSATSEDALAIATIHQRELNLGFLSTFNSKALELIYKFIIESEIVFVAEIENDIVGFVAGTVKTSGIFKAFILKHGVQFILFMLPRFFSLIFIRKVIETLSAPSNSSDSSEELPELLTIAVSSKIQAKGVGAGLLSCLEKSFCDKSVKSYKVIAGDILESANKFYIKNGFALSKQVELHKGIVSNVYVKELSK